MKGTLKQIIHYFKERDEVAAKWKWIIYYE